MYQLIHRHSRHISQHSSAMTSQKTALVTGTSKGGLGDHLAQELHRRGFRVFATARTPSKVQHLKDMGLDIVLVDVTDPKSIKKAAAEVNALAEGKLDILINNSGIGMIGHRNNLMRFQTNSQ